MASTSKYHSKVHYLRSNNSPASSQNLDTAGTHFNNPLTNTKSFNSPLNYKSYLCPGCFEHYDFNKTRNVLCGRVPLTLDCKHTLCEECAMKSYKRQHKVKCVTCSHEVTHVASRALQQDFEMNHYLMGQIFCSKQTSGVHVDGLNLVSTGLTMKNRTVSSGNYDDVNLCFETCGLGDCKELGTIRCLDCNGVYCEPCCVALHKSGKALWSHKTERVGKFSAQLEKCSEHVMDIELFCHNCEIGACCYCFLDKHQGHQKSYVTKLSDEERIEFQELSKSAQMILKQLHVTQKKLKTFGDTKMSTVEIDIGNYFANLHAQLYLIEKNLRMEASMANKMGSIPDQVHRSVVTNIETVKSVIEATNQVDHLKMNLRALLDKLKQIQNIPCYLVQDDNYSGTSKFVVDEVMDNIESYFSIDNSGGEGFRLVTRDELPESYVEEPLNISAESDTESSVTSCSTRNESEAPIPRRKDFGKRQSRKPRQQYFDHDSQSVFVTHINSLDSFYVRLKRHHRDFEDLRRNIALYIKHSPPVPKEIMIGNMYLALSAFNKKNIYWCRVRVIEEIVENGNVLYKIFYLDYGNVKNVGHEELRGITPVLTIMKPFAIHCKLANPSDVTWAKDAHLQLAKILEGKEVFMFVKNASQAIQEVELNIFTSVGGLTSVSDILVVACGALNKSSSESSGNLSSSGTVCTGADESGLYRNTSLFRVAEMFEVYLRYVVDPHNVSIQKACYKEAFDNQQKSLEKHYKKSNDAILPIKGSDVVVEYKSKDGGNWWRAEVLEVFMNKKMASVLLVDWGKKVNIPWNQMRMLHEEFKKTECLVHSAKLADIEPKENLCYQWRSETVDFLTRYLGTKQVLKMLVINNEPLEVVLFEPCQNYDECINAILVDRNLVKSTGNMSTTVQWPHAKPKTEAPEDNNFIIKVLDQSKEESEETDEDDDEIKQKVEVVKFESPDLIYIKFSANKEKEKQLYEELQIHYHESPEALKQCEPKMKCVAYDDEEKEYSRGIITSVEDDIYVVNLIDKARIIKAPRNKLFKLYDYFKAFPNIIYKCHLSDIKPAGDSGKWSKIALEWLGDTYKKFDDIYIRKVKDDTSKKSLPVIMWYSTLSTHPLKPPSRKLYSINKKLTKLGLAFRRQTSTSADEPKKVKKVIEESKEIPKEEEDILPEDEVIEEIEQEEAEPITDWLPPLPFQKREFNVWVTCAECEGYLYVHQETLHGVYKEMEAKLKTRFDILPPSKDVTWQQNDLCTIFYNDYWYRGKILKMLNATTAKVFMIDFGSDHEVKTSDLHKVIMYPDMPAFASKIKLYNVFAKSGKWLTSDVDNLLELVEEYSRVIIRGSLSAEVPLADVYSMKGVCLNDVLVAKCANLTRNRNYKSTTELSDDDGCIVEPLSDEEQERTESSAGHLSPVIDVEISDKLCYKYLPLPNTDEGEVVAMDIVNVLGYKSVILGVLSEDLDVNKFLEITQDVNENACSQPLLTELEVGKPCISIFSEDNTWYRAQIFKVNESDEGTSVSIFYVDYGNIEIVPMENIRETKPKWLDFPVRHYFASIPISLKMKRNKDFVLNFMLNLMGKTMPVKIVQRDHPLKVHICDKEGEFYYKTFIESHFIMLND